MDKPSNPDTAHALHQSLSVLTAADGHWAGTAADLLEAVSATPDGHTFSSLSPRKMSAILRQNVPALRAAGFMVEFTRQPDRTRTRMVQITLADPTNRCVNRPASNIVQPDAHIARKGVEPTTVPSDGHRLAVLPDDTAKSKPSDSLRPAGGRTPPPASGREPTPIAVIRNAPPGIDEFRRLRAAGLWGIRG